MSEQKREGFLSRLIGFALRIFFRLLYNQFAWTYDLIANIVSVGRWKSWIYIVIPYLENSDILELGHGPGHLLKAMSRQGLSSFGIDSSPYMTRIAAKRLSKSGFPLQLVLGKSQYLPYLNRHFKYVVSTFPSEYIYDPRTLKEVWRVLDNKGELIVIAWAWITSENWLDKLTSWLFQITDQAPTPETLRFKEQYVHQLEEVKNIGFQTSTECIERQDSKLLVIRAKKYA